MIKCKVCGKNIETLINMFVDIEGKNKKQYKICGYCFNDFQIYYQQMIKNKRRKKVI